MPIPATQNALPADGFRYRNDVGSRWRRPLDRAAHLALGALVALAVFLSAPRAAMAAGEDAAAQQTVKAVLDAEYADGDFGPASTKLNAALDHCKKCSGSTKARIYVVL